MCWGEASGQCGAWQPDGAYPTVDHALDLGVQGVDGGGHGDAHRADTVGFARDSDAVVVVCLDERQGVALAIAGNRAEHVRVGVGAVKEARRVQADAAREHHLALHAGRIHDLEATRKVERTGGLGELGVPERVGGYRSVVALDERSDWHLRVVKGVDEWAHNRAELFLPMVDRRVLVAVGVEDAASVWMEGNGHGVVDEGGHSGLLRVNVLVRAWRSWRRRRRGRVRERRACPTRRCRWGWSSPDPPARPIGGRGRTRH